MARRFALHFDVRVVVEADDVDGAHAALLQGVEDLVAADDMARDALVDIADDAPEAQAVAAALTAAVQGVIGEAITVVELAEAGAA